MNVVESYYEMDLLSTIKLFLLRKLDGMFAVGCFESNKNVQIPYKYVLNVWDDDFAVTNK